MPLNPHTLYQTSLPLAYFSPVLPTSFCCFTFSDEGWFLLSGPQHQTEKSFSKGGIWKYNSESAGFLVIAIAILD